MTVSEQVATAHGHERESIKDPRMKCDDNFCDEKTCKNWFLKAQNPDVARTA